MIPEKERDALMRLTMCARHQCALCKYSGKYTHEDCEIEITEDKNILVEAFERLAWGNGDPKDCVPVKHGHWLVNRFFIECSECGEPFLLKPQNYCPHCGARMDAERKEE